MNRNKHKFLTFAALMTGATVTVHLINRTVAAAAQLKQMLHIFDDNYFEWRFGNIYYTKKGTGSPILLIHDALQELLDMNGAKLKMNWQLTIPYILLIF